VTQSTADECSTSKSLSLGGALNTAASFVESLSSSVSVGEFAHDLGIVGTAFTAVTDITSATNGGITPGQAGLNLCVGVATIDNNAKEYVFIHGAPC
jgi:hypothetical protein